MRCLETKPQIDPMVCTTRVGLHYKAIKPTLLRLQSRKCHKQLRRCSGGIRMGDRMIEGLNYFTRKAVVANFETSAT